MSATVRCSLAELPGLLRKEAGSLKKRGKRGMVQAARDGSHAVAMNAPVAFAELRKSVHLDTTRENPTIVVDAPHAASVEVGSRPHTPPLEPLIAWVKLRGSQGLSKTGSVRSASRKAWGSTTAAASHAIASAIKQRTAGGVTNVDVPEQIARAIQMAIAKRGTKPHRFVFRTLGELHGFLDLRMSRAIRNR